MPDSRLVWIADVIDSTKKTTMLWTNADGDSLKALIYEGFRPWFIELSADSLNLILIGFQESLDSSSTVLLKTDHEGMVIDTKHYRILEDTYPNTFTVCPDSGFFLSGCDFPDTRIWFLKIDKDGETQWTQIYDWGVPYSPYEAIVASDGSYYIFSSWWDTMYVFQPFYLHLNKVGEIIKEEWPPLEDRDVYSAVLSGDTAVCLFGTAISDMGFYYNPWVCLVDTMLNVIWERSYDYGIDAYFHSAERKENGDYVTEIVLGYDIGLAWFDSHDIDTLMTMRYFTPGSLEIYGKLRLLSNGDIGLASNFRVPPSFNYNPLAFRVDSLGNHVISNISENVNRPKKLSLSAYPNPFNSAVTISFDFGSESAKPLSTIE
ncbi:MAG TPA: hypothetical protein ENN75_03650, partial [candidate division Zixibacteria bacterium]|nr:hypothetical protein [candidate division Zixibacteria bacterium]